MLVMNISAGYKLIKEKDTSLNVSSRDVSGGVECDANELSLKQKMM